jgi:3-deoxy-manno-octulosonate cytidylyltransferase (CMP-KDO synthetase)
MKVAVVIPARYASTRLPGKPLLKIGPKLLIQMVYEHAKEARCADTVVVATDDERIADAVRSFGGEARMTRPDHACGTDRVAEVVERHLAHVDAVVNVQGDEPDVEPDQIDAVAALLQEDREAAMTTLACVLHGQEAMEDPNQVKVVCDARGRALYFSRAPIPFVRDPVARDWSFLGHVGIYAYRREFLLKFTTLAQTELERKERLEQLRALEHGYVIRVGLTGRTLFGIDTPEDLERFKAKLARDASARAPRT